jgi:pre-mRNA-processing factor 39
MVVPINSEDLEDTGRKTPESIQVLEQLQELITPAYDDEADVVRATPEVQEVYETEQPEEFVEEYATNDQDVEEQAVTLADEQEEEVGQNSSMDIDGILDSQNFDYDAVAEEVGEEQETVGTMEVDQNETASSGNAIAEDLENGLNENDDTKTGLDADMVSEEELPVTLNVANAEVVSDEELPAVPKEAVKDAEEVSDDELPGPKMAELPADTEVVSEEELPASTKKRKAEDGYDPNSPTEATSADIPEKKLKTAEEEKAAEKEKVPEKPKKLPELDKYWKAVNDDVSDFTAWTYLLQYVDQEVSFV